MTRDRCDNLTRYGQHRISRPGLESNYEKNIKPRIGILLISIVAD